MLKLYSIEEVLQDIESLEEIKFVHLIIPEGFTFINLYSDIYTKTEDSKTVDDLIQKIDKFVKNNAVPLLDIKPNNTHKYIIYSSDDSINFNLIGYANCENELTIYKKTIINRYIFIIITDSLSTLSMERNLH